MNREEKKFTSYLPNERIESAFRFWRNEQSFEMKLMSSKDCMNTDCGTFHSSIILSFGENQIEQFDFLSRNLSIDDNEC